MAALPVPKPRRAAAWAVLALAAAPFLAGCESVRVDYDYDPAASFEHLATWAWREDPAPPPEDGSENPFRDQAVRTAVSEELRARGFREIGAGAKGAEGAPPAAPASRAGGGSGSSPDFTVNAFLAVRPRAELIYPLSSSWGCHDGWHSHGWHSHWGTGPMISTWDEGTLVLDFADGESGTPLWRGTASRAIDYDLTPEERRVSLREAVRAVLAKFPPPRAPGAATK